MENELFKQDFALSTTLKQGLNKTKLATVFRRQDKEKKQKKKGSGKAQEFIAKLSKGLMLPIAMLPIAGIFLGVGSAIVSNAGENQGLTLFGNFLMVPGNAIFGALPVLFAIAIAIAFTGDAGPAALAAFVGYLVFGSLQDALSTAVSYVDDTGTSTVLGYNLLFYTPGSMGSYSPSAIDGDGVSVYAGLPSSLFGDVIGINQLQSSVFGGFIVGFIVSTLYNRYKNVKLPTVIGFFNGVRAIPILVFLVLFPVTIIFLMIWPLIGILLTIIGQALGQAVGVNSLIFGLCERALVPFGLHHAFYSPLWYTSAGGSIDMTATAIIYYNNQVYAVNTSGGNELISWNQLVYNLTGNAIGSSNNPGSVAGDQTMWAFLNSTLLGREVYLVPLNLNSENYSAINGTYTGYINNWSSTAAIIENHKLTWTDLTSGQSALNTMGANGFNGVNIGQYMQGKYVFMILALPMAAAAMVTAAPKENRRFAMSICLSAGFTSFLTGITEPIEFTFLFLAPWLFWGVHAVFCALAFGLMNWIGLICAATGRPELAPHIGMSFSGGLLDWIIYGGIQMQYNSNAWWAFVFGLIYAPIYYFMFYYLIKRFDIHTPGRGDNVKLFTKEDYKNKQAGIQIANIGSLNDKQLFALNVVQAYGGFDNIKNVDACITKLRIQVDNQSAVDTNRLMELGAKGTTKIGTQSLYAVFGGEADLIKNDIQDLMKNIEGNPSLKTDYMKAIQGESVATSQPTVTTNQSTTSTSPVVTAPVRAELAKESIIIRAPFTGQIVSMSRVPDDTFRKNMMGVGVAIKPRSSKVYSPIKGKVSLVFNTNHAYIFESAKGSQILLHIGIDSINLKDQKDKPINPFTSIVKVGDSVKSGQQVGTIKLVDLKYAKSPLTPIVVLNETLEGREIKILKKSGDVKKGEPLFKILPKKN